MPRFVILEHDHPHRHWDLMLERGGTLWTWRLAQAPSNQNMSIEATPLADHRLEYLHYEGPVSNNRGTVSRWDEGEYESLAAGEQEVFRIQLRGGRTQGQGVAEKHAAGWVFRLEDANPVGRLS